MTVASVSAYVQPAASRTQVHGDRIVGDRSDRADGSHVLHVVLDAVLLDLPPDGGPDDAAEHERDTGENGRDQERGRGGRPPVGFSSAGGADASTAGFCIVGSIGTPYDSR